MLVVSIVAMLSLFKGVPLLPGLVGCVVFSFLVSTVAGKWAAAKLHKDELSSEREKRALREAETQRQIKAMKRERFEKGLD